MPKNFITPNVVKVEQHEDKILELSSGYVFNGKPVWGVSEFTSAETRYGLNTTGRSRVFDNLKEAQKYYTLLKY